MATINNSITLQDKMSYVLNRMLKAMTSLNNAMAKMDKGNGIYKNIRKNLSAADEALKIFSLDQNGLASKFEKVNNQASKSVGIFTKLRKSLIANFAIGNILSNIIMGVIYRIGDMIKSSIQMAADIVEVQNVINVAYQGNTAAVDEWSKHTLDAFGINMLNAKRYAGTMSAMLQSSGLGGKQAGDMSMKLVELAGDLSSFYNINSKDAFAKIRSGMAGMVMPLRTLGIDMTVATLQSHAFAMGITAKWKALSQAQKELVRYDYLMKVTQAIQGDFSRTYYSFANQQRLLGENWAMFTAHLANAFLPALGLVFIFLNRTIKAMYGLGQGVKAVWGFLKQFGWVIEWVGLAMLIKFIPAMITATASMAAAAVQAIATGTTMTVSFAAANAGPLLVAGTILLLIRLLNYLGVTTGQIVGAIAGSFGFFGAVVWDVVTALKQLTLQMMQLAQFNPMDVFSGLLGNKQGEAKARLWKAKWDYNNASSTYYNPADAYGKYSKFGEGKYNDTAKFISDYNKLVHNFPIGKGGFGNANAGGKPGGTKGNPLYTKMDDADIKALVDVAKVNYVNKFIKYQPNLKANFGDVHQNADVDGIIEVLANSLEEAHNSQLGD